MASIHLEIRLAARDEDVWDALRDVGLAAMKSHLERKAA